MVQKEKRMKNETVFFFDIDGLLLDSEKIYCHYWIQAASICGFSLSKEQALLLRSLDSSLAEELFQKWFGHKDVYRVVRSKRKEMMNDFLLTNKYEIKTGVFETLKYLKKNNNSTYAVTSNSFKKANNILAEYGFLDFFTGIISTEFVERGKPFPDVYLYAASLINTKPENCFVFEDSPNGVKSAYCAGCKTIMIPDLTPCDDELSCFVHSSYESLLCALKDIQNETGIFKQE